MAKVTITTTSESGLVIARIDLGLRRAPTNTSYDDILAAFKGIPGATTAGTYVMEKDVWGVLFEKDGDTPTLTTEELKNVTRVAQEIADKG